MKEYILPVRDLVVHPGLTVPVYIDNPSSVACIEAAAKHQKIVLAPQHSWYYPTSPDDLYDIGTIGDIAQVLRMPDGAVHAIIRTTDVVKIYDTSIDDNIFRANVTALETLNDMEFEQTIALRDRIADNLQALSSSSRKIKMDKLRNVISNYPMPAFVDAVVQMLELDTDVALKILCATTWREKLILLLEQIGLIAETAKIEDAINRRIQQQMANGQREAILHEKMRAIQKEMGEDSDEADAADMRDRIEKANLPADVREKALSEWRRLKSMPPMSNDGAIIKAYLDELLSMPWGQSDKSHIDLNMARDILNADHSGMESVKERILEHIAVMKKTARNQGSILCLVGAPGVGKTSLGKSIATALGRKYHRISLGGISDEAHFRGHRKTYLGAQTGRVMDALKRCKANNPVIVLDEIDKMGRDYRGDPESALLEILDPEQNKTFRDHYLEVDFDLSNVMFIATANSLNMSSALKDRMEIIEIPGYTEDAKLKIARNHLIQRAAAETGWDTNNILIDDDAIQHIIRNYTSEQGVRQLQRQLVAILRRALLENNGEDVKTVFDAAKIDELLALRKNAGLSKRIGFGIGA